MKRRKWFSILVVLVMISAMSTTSFAAPKASGKIRDTCAPWGTEATHFAAELMAGQNIDVGEVRIDATTTPNAFIVTYEVDEPGWFITELHFEAISNTDEKYIFSKGGLIPGSFACKKSWDVTDEITEYTFLYKAGAAVTGFAAHAVVCQPAVTETVPLEDTIILSDTNALFESAPDTWTSAAAAWVHPAWQNYPDTNELLITDGAIWIWDSYRVNNPVLGDLVEFMRDFTVVGVPTAATLTITADNAYAFKVNGGNETQSDSLFGDWRTSNLTDAFVSPVVGTWTTTEEYDVLGDITTGPNTLYVTGVNEYQGTLDGAPDGTIDSNPGAVIFKLVVESETIEIVTPQVCETAWGAGDDVAGGNWSMIIPLTTQNHICTVGLTNGGFEVPLLQSDWAVYDNAVPSTVPGWTIEWMGLHNPAFEVPNIEYQKIITPDQGLQYAELDSYGSVKIYQDIATCVHHMYTVSFAWSPRQDVECSMDVLWNGNVIKTLAGNTQGWTTETISDLVPNASGTTRLEFRETGTSDQLGMFLDDVKIAFD